MGRLASQRARGRLRSEEAERSIAIASIGRRLGVATGKAQASSLLGRLQMVSPGTNAAVGSRCHAQELGRQWSREEKAMALAIKQVFCAFRMGFAMTD